MHIRLLVASSLLFISSMSVSQVWCDMPAIEHSKEDSMRYDEFLDKVRQHELHPVIKTRSEICYQVVVHIVVRQSATFISNAQVIHQIDVLNNDFAGKGANISKLEKEFEPLISDTGIRFRLASIDPDGKPTDGITFTFTNRQNIALLVDPQSSRRAIHFNELGGKTGWDPERYINIWVGEYGSFLGSAFFPGMAPYPEEIGVVIDPRSFGSLGDAAFHPFYKGGHTLTHEMGHFFGLIHIWGGPSEHDCNDSDEVDDTPNQEGPYFDCPSGIQMSCGVSNMYQDFMDLTDDRCLAAFTSGQSARMHASIDAFYPDLGSEGSCQEIVQPFDTWYDKLIWANDRYSGQYVLYHPDGYAGKINLEVFSVDGRLVLKDTWEGSQTYLLNLNPNASGIFFVRLSDGIQDKVRKVVTFQ
ncbi:MAG: M43 family zinc metalloprotease [Saprospiraceae bacterium]